MASRWSQADLLVDEAHDLKDVLGGENTSVDSIINEVHRIKLQMEPSLRIRFSDERRGLRAEAGKYSSDQIQTVFETLDGIYDHYCVMVLARESGMEDVEQAYDRLIRMKLRSL